MIDQEGRLRADYKELQPAVQDRVKQLWDQVTSENLYEMTDFVGYKQEFLRLFGFEIEGVDYEADVDPDVMVVDEVLSVGDQVFQKKSFERMQSLMSGGTAVLLVSHALDQVVKRPSGRCSLRV